MRVRNEKPAQRGGRDAQSTGGHRQRRGLPAPVRSDRRAREVRSGKTRSATGRGNGPSSASSCRSSGWRSSCSGCRSTRRSGSSPSASPTASPAWPISVSSNGSMRGAAVLLYAFLLLDPIFLVGVLFFDPETFAFLNPFLLVVIVRTGIRYGIRTMYLVVGDDAGGVPSASRRAPSGGRTSSSAWRTWSWWRFGPVFFSSLIRRIHAIRAIEEERAAALATATSSPSPAAPSSPRSATSSARRCRGSSPRST